MTLDNNIHINILVRILKDIYEESSLGSILGFKGGTAAYLFYHLNRFSVDLDFDILDPNQEEDIFLKVQEILKKYGEIKQADSKRFSFLFILSYYNKAKGSQNIKVEINKRNFGSKFEIKPYLGISMKVMVQEDMFAHKLCAMYERIGKTNRDIYDVWFFLNQNWPINEEIIVLRTGLKFKEFLQKCIEALEKMSNQRILSGLGELLDAKQKVWVKNKLLGEVLFLIKLRIAEYKN